MSRRNRRDVWLDPIPHMLRDRALALLGAGDALGFLCLASNVDGLDLVSLNQNVLQERGIYEDALLDAFTGTRTNNAHWPLSELAAMFAVADRRRLRAAGDPIPLGPHILYRGVAGRGRQRRVRGLSWTASLEEARWFADRFAGSLVDAAVYTVTVGTDAVLARMHEKGRNEDEYILDPCARWTPKRFESRDPKAAA